MRRTLRIAPFLAVGAMLMLVAAAPAAPQDGIVDEPVLSTATDAVGPVEDGGETTDAPASSDGTDGTELPEASLSTDDSPAAEREPDDHDGDDAEAEHEQEDAAESRDELADLPVRAIVVRGNRHVDVAVILDAIQDTQVGQPLELEAVRADLVRIDELGYFADVRADTVQVEGGLRVIFQVVENPLITEVRVESEDVDADEIRRLLRIREGQVLNSVELDEDLTRIQTKVRDEQGLDLRLSRADLGPDGVLHLGFRVTRVKEVLVQGNQKTKDFVIRREISVQPGEPLRWDEITRSLDRLQRLGFFQDIRTRGLETDHPDYITLVFDVEERLTGTALVGAGYSSEDGLLGYAEVADRNFLGRGQHLSVRAEFGQRRTAYDLGFFEPYLFGSRNSFGINLYNRAFDRFPVGQNAYRERRTGGDVAFGRPISDTTRVSLRFRADNLRTEPLDEKEPIEPKTGRTRSVTLAAFSDTTDHWLSPLRGSRSRLSAELGGGMLGGDFHFTKYEGEYSRYFQVGSQKQAIAVRALGGWGVGDIRAAEEQFRIGGADTVRGYASGAMEGDRMLVLNAEYRFPLSDSVQGVIFTDAGEAWDQGVGSKGLKLGYGIGARLDTPLGVLRLDYGIGDEGGRLHFFFGPSF